MNDCLPYDYIEPKKRKPIKHPVITPQLHEEIKRLYQNKDQADGSVREFARRKGIPRWKIGRYAQYQGWIERKAKEPNWTDDEIRLLKKYAHFSIEIIRRKMKAKGFIRSITGIGLKLRRLRFRQNLDGQSAYSVSLCLGVDPHFVTRAIKSGKLKAEVRPLNRKPQQGGNPYYIKNKHLRKFITEYIDEIDLKKVDKYWFVDLLTGKDTLDDVEAVGTARCE